MSQIKATISGFSLLLATTSLLGIVDSRPVTAQSSVVPATNVTGVDPQGNQINISGGERSSDGTNLFHTFTEFGLNSGQVANFLSSPETLNIFSRVTGGNPSIINGQLQVTGGNTNLFLMNPAGVVFGSGATLNIPGDFTATTATGIGFGENRWLNATGTNDYSNLSGTPNTFAFGSTQPGAIINEAALSVSAGQDLTLLGGTVVSTKILEAPGGNITIAAVPGENLVRITPEGQALSLEVTPIPANSGITPPPGGFTPSPTIAQLITGGNVSNATSLSTNAQGQVELKGSGVTVTDGDIAVQNIRTNENLGLGSSGSVTMSAPGKISTGNINTTNEAGSGGAVNLNARGGISTGNINTSSSGDAGDVTLSTQGAVTIRNNINAMSSTGNGGDVELTAASADYNNIKTNGSISRNGNTPCLIGLCNNPGTDPVDNPPVEEPNPTQGGSEPDEEVPISTPVEEPQPQPTPVEEPQPQPTPVEEPNPAQGAPVDNPTTEEPDSNEGAPVDNPPTTEEPDTDEGAPVDNPPTTEEPDTDEGAPVDNPTTEEPDTDEDAPVDNPTTEEPDTDEGGSVDNPTTEEPDTDEGGSVDNPTTEEPDTDEGAPVDNPPTTEEPDTDEGAPVDNPPTTEEPDTDEGAPVDNPTTEEPDTDEGAPVDNPTTEEPDTDEGGSVDNPPTTQEPDTDEDGSNPDKEEDEEEEEPIPTPVEEPLPPDDGSPPDVEVPVPTPVEEPLPPDDGSPPDVEVPVPTPVKEPLPPDDGSPPDVEVPVLTPVKEPLPPDDGSPPNVEVPVPTPVKEPLPPDDGSPPNVEVPVPTPVKETLPPDDGNDEQPRSDRNNEPSRGTNQPITRDTETPNLEEPISSDKMREMASTSLQLSNSISTASSSTSTQTNLERESSTGSATSFDPVFVLEEAFTQEYEEYFGRPFKGRVKTAEDAREMTHDLEQAIGVNSAIVYVSFTPALITPEGSQCQSASVSSPQLTRSDRRFGFRRSEVYQQLQSSQGQTGDCSNPGSDQLEVLVITADGQPIRQRVASATRAQVLAAAEEFRRELTNPTKTNTTSYLSSAQQLYQWLIKPLEKELEAQEIENLVFVMDSGLRSLPIAALHDGKQFLAERYSTGMVPSLSLTEGKHQNIENAQVLAMGASKFPNDAPLPAVPVELNVITEKVWQGKSYLNENFTLENLRKARSQQPYRILHLATHAEFSPGSPENSYIQMWDRKLRLGELRQLGLADSVLDLLVLSACRTALGDEEAELGFAGSALAAGVKSTLATLWYVKDEGTLGLMTEFYRQLGETPMKSEALRQAQVAMLRGEVKIENGQLLGSKSNIPLPPELVALGNKDLSHPFFWAAFTLVGEPW